MATIQRDNNIFPLSMFEEDVSRLHQIGRRGVWDRWSLSSAQELLQVFSDTTTIVAPDLPIYRHILHDI